MYLAEEDEAFVVVFEEWFNLEERLCQKAIGVLVREGHDVDRDHGLYVAIAPFMERNGYRDACGWWVRTEENATLDVADDLCPECGTPLEGFVEGSSMGSRCPKCSWSVVTTYPSPIQEDERRYAIAIMPGGTPTKEALRVVSRIAACNYAEAKKLMAGAPTALYSGHAAEVLARKNDLEAAGVPIEVHPDFPYGKDGRLANEARLNGLLLTEFPELKARFEEYTSWQDGMETGCFVTYEDSLLPTLIDAFKCGNAMYIKRGCGFIEQLITSDDEYARNLANVGLLEGLKAHVDNALVRPFLGPVSLEEFDTLVY